MTALTCQACGEVFESNVPRPRRKYCSVKCVTNAQGPNRSGGRPPGYTREPSVPSVCIVCNTGFMGYSSLSIYCSDSCKVSARKSRPRERYATNPKAYQRWVETRTLLFEQQDGKCAICGDVPTKPFLDHCHKTKQIRGVLCTRCNAGLGMFLDDPTRLSNAIAYLVTHEEGTER